MKATLSLMGLLAFAACIQSCKKNNTATPAATTRTEYLSQVETIFESLPYSSTFSYDSQKRMIKYINNTRVGQEIILYSYNDQNRLIGKDDTSPLDGVNWETKTEYTYDDTQSIVHEVQTIYKDNAVFSTSATDYVFLNSRVTEIHTDAGTISTFTYDANGNRSKIQDNDGTTTVFTFTDKKSLGKMVNLPTIDPYQDVNLVAGSVTSTTGSPDYVTNHTYTFDANGYVATDTQVRPTDTQNNITVTYAYDANGYVTALSDVYPNSPAATTKYAYTYVQL